MTENGIRGHHLGYLLQVDRAHMQYETAGVSSYEAKARAAADVREWMNGVLWDMSSMAEQDPANEDYYLDVIGSERSNTRQIARSFATALLGLYNITDEPISIHSQKDGICQSCAVGRHCEEETYDYDMPYMRDVIYHAKKLGLPYEFKDGVLVMQGNDLKMVVRHMNRAEVEFSNDYSRF